MAVAYLSLGPVSFWAVARGHSDRLP